MYLAVLLTRPDSSSRNLFHSTIAASRGKPLQHWPISGVDRATPKQVIVPIQIGSRMQGIVRMAFQADATTLVVKSLPMTPNAAAHIARPESVACLQG